MATATLLKLIFALAIFLVILIAGWYPFKKKNQCSDAHLDFPIGETLATGVFLGAALLHMLPEASKLFSKLGYNYPFAYIITGAVFLVFLWFEHLGKEIYHHSSNTNHPAFALLAWTMLSIHSLILGAALGINDNQSFVLMLFFAIVIHKWAESFAISIQLNKSSLKFSQSLGFFLAFALMTPLGILLGYYFSTPMQTNSLIDPLLMAASAGTFLYLGTLHGLERCVMVERCCNLKDFSYVIIGFLLMAIVAIYV